jgi:hypothetical protein
MSLRRRLATMLIGLIWIIAGLAIALMQSLPDGMASLAHPAGVAWQLNLMGAIGLLLACLGCRMFQAGHWARRWG